MVLLLVFVAGLIQSDLAFSAESIYVCTLRCQSERSIPLYREPKKVMESGASLWFKEQVVWIQKQQLITRGAMLIQFPSVTHGVFASGMAFLPDYKYSRAKRYRPSSSLVEQDPDPVFFGWGSDRASAEQELISELKRALHPSVMRPAPNFVCPVGDSFYQAIACVVRAAPPLNPE